MHKTMTALWVGMGALLAPALASAHIAVASGPGFANTTQVVSFGVGHGCEGSDTYKVRIEIPAGVTSVRPEWSEFGKVSVEKDAAGTVTAVVWQKSDQALLDADISYYTLKVRLKVPNQPFSTLYFPTHQTCKASDGTLSQAEWVGIPNGSGGSTAPEPAPALQIVPARSPGWNKFTIPSAIADLSVFFGDAQIVWKGKAAYSPSATTMELAKATSGVTELTSLQANDEVWVRY
ncbi:DUF1775 domain-containing protein [Pyxidicoccus parkwayensis]|uniref:DUF1775 domain-containing protein n=1 Tax=Pyxidicoccus parkwayensis TaxID=2813578 RepID=A0ABX7P9M7_9BACT|nr:DUF1775 domain-containing protein [Pyxidicoccus parkwaysis]QSQ27149.1 DUF1775 domain-containing protein [Pyxidicoccus parkwaysis]